MKSFIITTFLLLRLLNNSFYAQSSSNCGGVDVYSSHGSVSMSYGEVFFYTKGDYYASNEGVQNGMTINPIKSINNIAVSIYPNPTSDVVFFKVQDLYYNNLAYKIYNNVGIEILNGRIVNSNTYVSLRQLPASTYVIKVYRAYEESISYQIIKVQ